MKDKLTKEQTEWLIDQVMSVKGTNINVYLSKDPIEACKQGIDAAHDKFTQILNECTEKEFPEFQMSIENGNITIKSRYYKGCKNEVGVNMDDTHFFTGSEFKEFIEKCNKIVEWIDE